MVKVIRNMKIRAKLYILVGVALAGMLIIGGVSFVLMGTLNENTSDIATSWLPSVDVGRDMTATLSNVRLNELGYLTALTPEVAQSSLGYLEKEKAQMDSLLSEYSGLIDEEENSFYEKAYQLWSSYSEADARLIGLAQSGQTDEARSILEGECVDLYNNLNAALDEIVTYNLDGSEEITAQSESTYHNAVLLLSVIMGIIILLGVILSFVVIRAISVPVGEIKDAVSEMAQGNLDAQILYQSKDELGILANQTRMLIRRLHAIINDERQLLSQMAAGDFTVTSSCEKEYMGGFRPLLVSMKEIAAELNHTMLQISGSASRVASGSDQVSNGAQALSQGSTQQASSVEELASTINDVSERVRQNAENAREASQMADRLEQEMEASNQKMDATAKAMNDINSSSEAVSKIIKTIEDIAFQTNILALNASVEAARAGSAGMGFAVVAEEVRNLADRSAEAAHDTSTLIETILERVKNGTHLTAETAQALVQTVGGVRDVAGTVSRISSASAEQSKAISQITERIGQISEVVQTNSATAQESAAASEELSDQADILHRLVAKFRLNEA